MATGPTVPRDSADGFASVVNSSIARFIAEGMSAALALFTGIVTARNLGPAGKGALSMLSYLIAVMAGVCSLGLGEAAITLTGRRLASPQRAFSGSLAAVVPTALIGGVVLVLVCKVALGSVFEPRFSAVPIAGLTVVIAAMLTLLTSFTEAMDRVLWTSGIRAVTATITTAATVVLVTFLGRSLAGAVLAMALGSLAGGVLLCLVLWRLRVAGRPRGDVAYLRAALRIGIPVQLSFVMLAAGARVDLFLVNAIKGAGAAGNYSVALTLGELAAYAPFAISIATYPRLAGLAPGLAAEFAARVTRLAVALAVLMAIPLALLVPPLVAIIFGPGYAPAAAPAVVLIGATGFWAGQWVLCRSLAATGEPKVLLRSFALNLVVMVMLDVVLIDPIGLVGAALASACGAAAGAAYAVVSASKTWEIPKSAFLPGRTDLREILAMLASTMRTARRRFRPMVVR